MSVAQRGEGRPLDSRGRGVRVREGVLEAKSQSGNVVRLPRDSTHGRVAVKGGLEPRNDSFEKTMASVGLTDN